MIFEPSSSNFDFKFGFLVRFYPRKYIHTKKLNFKVSKVIKSAERVG